MMLDEARGQIYYVANTFFSTAPDFGPSTVKLYILGVNGTLLRNQLPTYSGTVADAHYRLLYLDEHRDLYAAWTTASTTCTPTDPFSYCSSHVMRSRDGGWNWPLGFSEFWAEGADLPPNTRHTATITSSGADAAYPIATPTTETSRRCGSRHRLQACRTTSPGHGSISGR